MNTSHFGEHVTIDGYGGSEALLNNKDLVLGSLSDLPAKLGMTTLSEPQVFWAESNHIKDPGGWSGFVVIAESHISIHTFPKRGFVSIDAYTCKNGMDTDFIIKYFTERFELKDTEVNFLKRGTKYPEGDIY
ncbi:MAG: adenosylmethionine decarboxylase [Candidatus Pacebacteria bacterium]|nr:adenosylmethionine decarboxylase [Candidatus Paceibacterota bacterium]